MANDKLENLAKIGQLKVEPATEEEIAGLQQSGAVRLADAKTKFSVRNFVVISSTTRLTHCHAPR
jgi:hypothetical protein